MTLAEHEIQARLILEQARVDSPGLCARILTAFAANLTNTQYILAWRQTLPPDRAALLTTLVNRRAKGEPLSCILGKKEFYGLDFYVNSSVLTPRPETELLIDLALARFAPDTALHFADLCSGSGCIAITLSKHRPLWRGILCELSLPALEVSVRNISAHSVPLFPVQGDIFHLPLAADCLDLVVSNPPYIAPEEKPEVMWETLAWEPHSALFSPCGGLRHLKEVIREAHRILKHGGAIMLEHGARQPTAVKTMLENTGFCDIELHRDLAGLPRCAVARKS